MIIEVIKSVIVYGLLIGCAGIVVWCFVTDMVDSIKLMIKLHRKEKAAKLDAESL